VVCVDCLSKMDPQVQETLLKDNAALKSQRNLGGIITLGGFLTILLSGILFYTITNMSLKMMAVILGLVLFFVQLIVGLIVMRKAMNVGKSELLS
jgi:hypothetical protein